MPAVIRPAMASDIDAIAVIYAYHVNHSTGTFETEAPDSIEMTRRWKEVEARSLPWLVAEENGEITGYAYAAPYRTRAAYQHTVEDSIYVRADRVGTGLGKLLMPALIRAAQQCGMHQIPESMLKDIFLPFFRTESGREEGNGGTGLGLAIASEAIAIHGGTITAQNRKGGGFEVRMMLPQKTAAGEERLCSSVTVN